jgi:hypothetical protein
MDSQFASVMPNMHLSHLIKKIMDMYVFASFDYVFSFFDITVVKAIVTLTSKGSHSLSLCKFPQVWTLFFYCVVKVPIE